MTHDQIEEAIPPYAIGALERSERQAVESHLLSGCGSCHVLLKDYHSVAAVLPYALPPMAPPPKAKILSAVFARAQTPVAPDRPTFTLGGWFNTLLSGWPGLMWQPAVSLVLLVLLAGTGFYAWSAHRQVGAGAAERAKLEAALQEATTRVRHLQAQVAQREQTLAGLRDEFGRRLGKLGEAEDRLIEREAELDLLRRELAQREQEAAGLRKAVAQRDEMLTFLKSAQVKVVSLTGLEQAKSAGALLLYDQETKKAFFYAFNMPSLPSGKTYQLWAIVDKPVSAGTFETDSGQKGRLIIKNLPDLSRITKFAVSLEPQGGRPQPTGAIYLAGQV